MNYEETKTYLTRYIKARIPIITINTLEKDRIIRMLNEISNEENINFNLFQMSQGITDLRTNTLVSEDKTIMSALDFISNDIKYKENCNYILSGISDIRESTVVSRYLLDVIEQIEKKSGSIILITNDFVWNNIQRLGIGIELSYPTEEELIVTVKNILNSYKNQINIEWTEEDYKLAASYLQGLSEMEVKNIISSLIVKGEIIKEDLEELKNAKKTLINEIAGLEYIDVDSELEVAGLNNLIAWIEEKKSLTSPTLKEELKARGIQTPKGVLLTGVPGCGKSLCSKVIAQRLNIPLYRLDLATVQGEYVGQSERQLKEALETAEYVSPCVLWIDEIEKGLKESSSSNTTSKMIGQFLFWLQECKKEVFVVASANSVEDLPPELIRKGRFDEIFFVDLPNPLERKELLSLYSKKYLKVNIEGELIDTLVNITDGFSSADIEATLRGIAYKTIADKTIQLSEKLVIEELQKVVSLSKTNPEKINKIRQWGKERAIPASK